MYLRSGGRAADELLVERFLAVGWPAFDCVRRVVDQAELVQDVANAFACGDVGWVVRVGHVGGCFYQDAVGEWLVPDVGREAFGEAGEWEVEEPLAGVGGAVRCL